MGGVRTSPPQMTRRGRTVAGPVLRQGGREADQGPGRARDHGGAERVQPSQELCGRRPTVEEHLAVQAEGSHEPLGTVPVPGILAARQHEPHPRVPGPHAEIPQGAQAKCGRDALLHPCPAHPERLPRGSARGVHDEPGRVHPTRQQRREWRRLQITARRDRDAREIGDGSDVARLDAMALEQGPVVRHVRVGVSNEPAQLGILERDDLVPRGAPVAGRAPEVPGDVEDTDHGGPDRRHALAPWSDLVTETAVQINASTPWLRGARCLCVCSLDSSIGRTRRRINAGDRRIRLTPRIATATV